MEETTIKVEITVNHKKYTVEAKTNHFGNIVSEMRYIGESILSEVNKDKGKSSGFDRSYHEVKKS